MPVDPSIILAGKPVEVASPMQTIGGLMQLREMSSQIALRNAQTEQARQNSADIEAQAKQRTRDLQSWNQMKDLMKDPAVQQKLGSGDFSPIWDAGVSPNIADTAIKNLQGMASTAQTLQKGKADFYAGGRASLAVGLAGLHPKDDEAAAAQYNGLRQTLAAEHPELAQKLPVLTAGPGFRDQIYDLAASNGVARSILENQAKLEAEQATTSEKTAQASKLGVETTAAKRTQALQELSAVDPKDPASWARWAGQHPDMTPPASYDAGWVGRQVRSGMAPEKQPEYDIGTYKAKMGLLGNGEFDQYLAQFARSKGKTPVTMQPPEFFEAMQKFAELKQDPTMRQLAISQKQLAETMARMQMAQMPSDADYQTLARSLLDKSLSPTQFNELKAGRMGQISPSRVFLIAKQMDPSFSMGKAETEFKAYEKTEADFTSGRQGDMARAGNNAIEHTGLLEQARIALKNSDVPAMAHIANWFGVQAGSSLKTTYDLIARKVGDEWEKFYVSGGGGEGERKMSADDFSSSKGDAQIAGNIRAAIHLGDSQIRNLQDQYKRGTYGQGSQQLFTPEALAVRQRILGGAANPGQISVTDPKGGVHYFSNQADADKFKQLAGIK